MVMVTVHFAERRQVSEHDNGVYSRDVVECSTVWRN